jgi:hypothetical protein
MVGGMDAWEAKRLRPDAMLDNVALKDFLSKTW